MCLDGADAAVDDGTGWYFEVNGAQVPTHRVTRDMTPYYQKLAFGIHGSDHGNLVGNDLIRNADNSTDAFAGRADFFATHYLPCIRFNHAASDKRLLSGIDARSNPVQLVFNHTSDGSSAVAKDVTLVCLLYTSPSPRDGLLSRMPSSA